MLRSLLTTPVSVVLTCLFLSIAMTAHAESESGVFTEPDQGEVSTEASAKWYRSLVAQVRVGQGFPSQEMVESRHLELQLGTAISRNTIVGVFFGPSQSKKLDTVYFPATGYTEKRTYGLDTTLIGLWTNILLTDRLSVILAAGLSNTNSELEAVESNGPLTIEPGHPASSKGNLTYRAGVNYLISFQSLSIGPEIGYSSSSSNHDAEVKEIYGSFILRFDSRLL